MRGDSQRLEEYLPELRPTIITILSELNSSFPKEGQQLCDDISE